MGLLRFSTTICLILGHVLAFSSMIRTGCRSNDGNDAADDDAFPDCRSVLKRMRIPSRYALDLLTVISINQVLNPRYHRVYRLLSTIPDCNAARAAVSCRTMPDDALAQHSVVSRMETSRFLPTYKKLRDTICCKRFKLGANQGSTGRDLTHTTLLLRIPHTDLQCRGPCDGYLCSMYTESLHTYLLLYTTLLLV